MRARLLTIVAAWLVAGSVAAFYGFGRRNALVPILCLVITAAATWALRPPAEKGNFTITGPGEIAHSAGYSVKMTTSSLLYREDGRTITFHPSFSPSGRAIFKIDPKTPLGWDDTAEGSIDREGQYRIRRRIARALGFLQFTSMPQRRGLVT